MKLFRYGKEMTFNVTLTKKREIENILENLLDNKIIINITNI